MITSEQAIPQMLPERHQLGKDLDVQFKAWGRPALKSFLTRSNHEFTDRFLGDTVNFDSGNILDRWNNEPQAHSLEEFTSTKARELGRLKVLAAYAINPVLDNQIPEIEAYADYFMEVEEQYLTSTASTDFRTAFAAAKRLYIVREQVAPFRNNQRFFPTSPVQAVFDGLIGEEQRRK